MHQIANLQDEACNDSFSISNHNKSESIVSKCNPPIIDNPNPNPKTKKWVTIFGDLLRDKIKEECSDHNLNSDYN